MASLAARTAAAWRAEQDLRPDHTDACIDRATADIHGPAPICICGADDALPLVTEHTAHILIPAMQVIRPELAHFAGAAHRDPIALAVVQEWQLDREASEDVLRERGRARRGGGR
jgi:hypothetical protein